ncbi:MAG: hypothetical protein OQK75_10690 [Gammaproteobacteria bacterium]|nr:hypothetical protein [Gammaproteobacteria bacterium]
MKKLTKHIKYGLLIFVLFYANTSIANILISHEGDSIFYDEANNHYVIKYVGINGQINEVIWTPPTNISVEVEAKYKSLKDGGIKYEYKIEVDEDSKQPLVAFQFYTSLTDDFYTNKPTDWKEIIRGSYVEQETGKWINWYTTSSPVTPKNEIEGFEVTGMALPVYSNIYFEGDTEILAFPDSGPNLEVQEFFQEKVVLKGFNGKAVYTAVPLIPISEPFNLISTYTSFHKYLFEYIEKQFIDPVISTSLIDASTAVLTALTANDVKGGLSNLKIVKKLVEGEDENHKNEKGHEETKSGKPQPLIIKELRKILKFNIKFIKKKLEGQSDHED